jgi:outer membrane receptor protein involved in Fe transport
VFSPASRISLSFDATLKQSTGDPPLRFEPRFSIDYRVAKNDAFRLAVGSSSEEPSLQTNRVDLLPVGALNPDCGSIAAATVAAPADVEIGSGPAAGLAAETASNRELHYGHEFGSDAAIGVTLYEANVTNRIITAALPAGAALAPSELAPLRSRIEQFCGLSPAPGSVLFTLGRSFNAATARLRGIELGGRARITAGVALDYAYDVQSTVLDDLPSAVLATDPTLVNGAQAFEVPLHKATLGVAFAMRGGLRASVEGHTVGANNPQQLPAYAYADASLSDAVSKHVSLSVAASNVFNSHAQTYGLVGFGVPYATNAYHAALAAPFVQPFNERYGLAPATVTLSAMLHL